MKSKKNTKESSLSRNSKLLWTFLRAALISQRFGHKLETVLISRGAWIFRVFSKSQKNSDWVIEDAEVFLAYIQLKSNNINKNSLDSLSPKSITDARRKFLCAIPKCVCKGSTKKIRKLMKNDFENYHILKNKDYQYYIYEGSDLPTQMEDILSKALKTVFPEESKVAKNDPNTIIIILPLSLMSLTYEDSSMEVEDQCTPGLMDITFPKSSSHIANGEGNFEEYTPGTVCTPSPLSDVGSESTWSYCFMESDEDDIQNQSSVEGSTKSGRMEGLIETANPNYDLPDTDGFLNLATFEISPSSELSEESGAKQNPHLAIELPVYSSLSQPEPGPFISEDTPLLGVEFLETKPDEGALSNGNRTPPIGHLIDETKPQPSGNFDIGEDLKNFNDLESPYSLDITDSMNQHLFERDDVLASRKAESPEQFLNCKLPNDPLDDVKDPTDFLIDDINKYF